uniref:Putative secreted protein n=1 Tax=Anopheles marajoara TaxID=58244 RepID=A0A2M4C7H4_9DIPT
MRHRTPSARTSVALVAFPALMRHRTPSARTSVALVAFPALMRHRTPSARTSADSASPAPMQTRTHLAKALIPVDSARRQRTLRHSPSRATARSVRSVRPLQMLPARDSASDRAV